MNPRGRDATLRFALAMLPAPLLQLGFDFAIAALARRHASVLHRLRPCAGARILIEPLDARRALLLVLGEPPGGLSLRVAGRHDGERATARIAGPLSTLLDLLQGSADGDALFFARDLAISGDTEAILALRNALDGAEIDLVEDLLAALGPFGLPARAALDASAAVARLATAEIGLPRPALGGGARRGRGRG